VKDFNASKAALRAGYSPKSAPAIGHEVLKKPEIMAAIQQHMGKMAQKAEITAERVLDEIRKLAFSNLPDVLTVTGGTVTIKDFAELSPDVKAAIESVRETKDGCLAIKMHDKRASLEMLMKYLGLYVERVEHSGPNGGPIQHQVEDLSKLSIKELKAYRELRAKTSESHKEHADN